MQKMLNLILLGRQKRSFFCFYSSICCRNSVRYAIKLLDFYFLLLELLSIWIAQTILILKIALMNAIKILKVF